MVLARFVFAAIVQALSTALFASRHRAAPVRAAARWWMLTGILVDLASAASLDWLTRREGIRFRDLLGPPGPPHWQEVLRDLAWLVGVAQPPAIAAATLITRRFYGSEPPPLFNVAHGLPGWARAYGVLVWPAIWGVVEELVYLGYALPRLEVQLGRTRLAAATVALGWAGQHAAVPFLPDRRYLVSRIASALPVTSAMTAFFLWRGRRLLAPIIAHWLSNMATAILITIAGEGRSSVGTTTH